MLTRTAQAAQRGRVQVQGRTNAYWQAPNATAVRYKAYHAYQGYRAFSVVQGRTNGRQAPNATAVRYHTPMGYRALRTFSDATHTQDNTDKDLAMPTPRSLGFDLTYQACPNRSTGKRKIAFI
jgi:hypothetical protein